MSMRCDEKSSSYFDHDVGVLSNVTHGYVL